MLVLSRLKDEVVMIGDVVSLTIVDIRGSKARIGIIAPREIPVHRLEVFEAIRRDNPEIIVREREQFDCNKFLFLGDEPTPIDNGMLVLSRHKSEVILISSEIRIEVIQIRGNRVRLGIEAPKDIPIYRKEIYDTKRREGS